MSDVARIVVTLTFLVAVGIGLVWLLGPIPPRLALPLYRIPLKTEDRVQEKSRFWRAVFRLENLAMWLITGRK